MLWLGLKIGDIVQVGESIVVYTAKAERTVSVSVDGVPYDIERGLYKTFTCFSIHSRQTKHGLRLGFNATESIPIRRIKRET